MVPHACAASHNTKCRAAAAVFAKKRTHARTRFEDTVHLGSSLHAIPGTYSIFVDGEFYAVLPSYTNGSGPPNFKNVSAEMFTGLYEQTVTEPEHVKM